MAVPRLVLILIAGAVLLPAAFVVSRQAADAGSENPAPAPVAAPAKPAPTDASKPVKPRPKTPKPRARSKADRVTAAVARGRTIVLMLSDGRGADHSATARAVAAVRRRTRRIRVFSDRLKNLERYRAVIGSLGVAQSPAVVIVGRGRRAQVIEGYVDPPTLLQAVRDARR